MSYLQYTYLYQLLNKQFKCFVTIFMIYLPLGSVVILNKKYLGKAFEVDDIQEVRIVITQRFVCIPDTETFYPYGGVLHPIGHIEGEKCCISLRLKLWGCCSFLISVIFSTPLHKNRAHRLISIRSDAVLLILL